MCRCEKSSYAIQAVENALDMLKALSEEREGASLKRLSERLELHKTKVFRLLATFEQRGYVERMGGSGNYRLGLSAYEMGQKVLQRMELLRQAKPVMERLARTCEEAVYVAVDRDEEILFMDMADSLQKVAIAPLVGQRFPLRKTAAGQAILASRLKGRTAPAGQIQGTCPQEAVDRGGLGDGIACLAVPLLADRDRTVGSLCLIGPEYRMAPERVEHELFPPLRDAGRVVSSRLGHVCN